MKKEDIKPIPKYILKLIEKKDKEIYPKQDGFLRFYAYLTVWHKEVVKITVAVKNRYKKWHCKQVAIHGVHTDHGLVRDMVYHYIAGYSVGWYYSGLGNTPKWYEDNVWYECNDHMFDPWCRIINPETILKRPEYKYSAAELYNGCEIIKYLRTYEKYPQLEYLMKLGIDKHNIIFSKQILNKMGKDKSFCKWLAKNREVLKQRGFYIETILAAYKTGEDLLEVQRFKEAKKSFIRESGYKDLKDFVKDDERTFFEYIRKQSTSVPSYNDYITACKALEIDLSLKKNKYPNDFKRWHDIRIDEYKTLKAKQNAEIRKQLYAKFADIAEKYGKLQYDKKGEYLCIIARSPQDLIEEGERLNHCVGRMGYDQKFAREESLIFFIRSKESPEDALVTVEYSPKNKRVMQCYGDNDSRPSDEILNYVNKVWLPYANRTLKKIAA